MEMRALLADKRPVAQLRLVVGQLLAGIQRDNLAAALFHDDVPGGRVPFHRRTQAGVEICLSLRDEAYLERAADADQRFGK